MTPDLALAPNRHRFVVDLDPLPDALVRTLGPFAVRQITLTSVRCDQLAEHGRCVAETVGLRLEQAEQLRLRLAQMPWVRGVEVRWLARIAG
ncbi:MAG: hypothetical protein ABW360_15640 [Phenylobacterium sp.]